MRWLDRFLRDWRIRKALPHVLDHPSPRVLDIGCLDRTLLHAASPSAALAVGVDPLAEPARFDNVRVLRGVVPGIDPGPAGLGIEGEAGERFDRITMLAVLEHVPDPAALARTCFDLLKPGGRVVITVPDPKVDHVLEVLRRLRLIDGMSLEEHHGFESKNTPAIFEAAGFRTVVAERFQLGLNNLFVFEKVKGGVPGLQRTGSPLARATRGTERGTGRVGSPRLGWIAVAFMALVVLARLLLVSHQEVATFSADDVTYTYISSGGYWGNPYTTYGFSRHPGYPLFMSACTMLGLPLRLGIEFVGLAAAWACAVGLRRLGVASGLAAGAFALIALHPHTITLFNRVLPDTLYAPGWLLLAIGLAVAANARSVGSAVRWGALAGLGGVICATTRAEGIMVPALVASAAGVTIVAAWWNWLRARGLPARERHAARFADGTPEWSARLGVVVILPLAITFAATTAIKVVNYREQGIYALADIDAPGFKRLFRTLLSIEPDKRDPRLPVPLDVRTRARAASPTYDRLLTSMENDPSSMGYQNGCKRTTGIDGEWGSWTIWAMRQGAWYGGKGGVGQRWKSAGELDAFYAQAADELGSAIDVGKLESRFTPVTFMPPDWGPLLDALPKSARATWLEMVKPLYNRIANEALSERQVRQFDATALRRAELSRVLDEEAEFKPTSFWHRKPVVEELDRVKRGLASAVAPITVACVVIAAAGFIASAISVLRTPRRTPAGQPHWSMVAMSAGAILLAAVLGRFLLTALLDASGVPAQSRYILPGSLILPALAALGLHAIGRGIAAWARLI